MRARSFAAFPARALLLAHSLLLAIQILEAAPETSTSRTYLRVANLLPIHAPSIDIYRGADRYLAGAKFGYIQSYLSVPPQGGNKFAVKQGDKTLGTFTIPQKNGVQFYTLVITQDPGKSAAITFKDDAPKKIKLTPGDRNPPPPKPRLRIYAGGYDFALKVSAKGIGDWIENKQAVVAEQEIAGTPPKEVQLTFVDKYNQTISLYFPTDYNEASCYSAFVSQRGIKRPRIQVFADNTPPEGDPLDATSLSHPSRQ